MTLPNFGNMNPRHLEENKSKAEDVLRRELEKLKWMQGHLSTAEQAIYATLSNRELFSADLLMYIKARAENKNCLILIFFFA